MSQAEAEASKREMTELKAKHEKEIKDLENWLSEQNVAFQRKRRGTGKESWQAPRDSGGPVRVGGRPTREGSRR